MAFDGHLHHKDHDVTNDVADNIEVMHQRCHNREHFAGVHKTLEHRQKTGRKGRVFTDEWKAKLTMWQLQCVQCDQCDYVHTPQYVGRHKKAVHL